MRLSHLSTSLTMNSSLFSWYVFSIYKFLLCMGILARFLIFMLMLFAFVLNKLGVWCNYWYRLPTSGFYSCLMSTNFLVTFNWSFATSTKMTWLTSACLLVRLILTKLSLACFKKRRNHLALNHLPKSRLTFALIGGLLKFQCWICTLLALNSKLSLLSW